MRTYVIRILLMSFCALLVVIGSARLSGGQSLAKESARQHSGEGIRPIGSATGPHTFSSRQGPQLREEGPLPASTLGPLPRTIPVHSVGVVLRYLGSEYWQLVVRGMQSRARPLGLSIDVQAGSSEADPEGQLAVAEGMIKRPCEVLLVCPQTPSNLAGIRHAARKEGIRIINLIDGIGGHADHLVGPDHYESGMRAATYFLRHVPQGGQLAVISGPEELDSVRRRNEGFQETLRKGGGVVVASIPCEWDLQAALVASARILRDYPDLKGLYCHSDAMALGAVQAVKAAGRLGEVHVVGTEGIQAACDSIRKGELSATVDTCPYETGRMAVEMAASVLSGEKVPHIRHTPQGLVTKENVAARSPGPAR